MTIDQLRACVLVGVEKAPAPFPLTNPPADELKVSHVRLIVDLTLRGLGLTIDANGLIVGLPPGVGT